MPSSPVAKTNSPPSPGRMTAVRRMAGSATAFLTLGNIASQIFSFLGGVVISRVLGRAGRGTTALVAAYDDLSNNALSLGVPPAVGYHAARSDHDRQLREQLLLGSALKVAVLVTPLAAVLAWALSTFALGGASGRIALLIFLAIAGTPLINTVPTAGRMILTSRGQLRRLGSLTLAVTFGRLTVFVLLWQIGELTAFNAALAFLVVGWGLSAVTWFVVGVKPRRGGPTRELLRYGVRVMPGTISDMANSRLDQIIIAPFLGASDLGIYAVAVGVAFLPTNVASSMSLSIYRSVAQDSEDRVETRRRVRRAAKLVVAAGALTAVGSILFIQPIYGSEFAASVVPAVLLAIGSSFLGVSGLFVAVGNASGEPKIGSIGSLLALGVTLAGLPILLPILGVEGAAIVTLVAYGVRLLCTYRLTSVRGLLGPRRP